MMFEVKGDFPPAWNPQATDPDWQVKVGKVGVCCSGGGIRSASYNLGALQVLQSRGVLERAAYLASVSGGGYIAGGMNMLASSQQQELVWGPENLTPTEPRPPRPFSPRSPEEQYLRNHSSYLAPNATGLVKLLSELLLGMVVNLIFVGAILVIFGRLLGRIAAWVNPSLALRIEKATAPDLAWVGIVLGVLAGLAFFVLIPTVVRRVTLAEESDREAFVVQILVGALFVATVLFVLPWFIGWSRGFLFNVGEPLLSLVKTTAIKESEATATTAVTGWAVLLVTLGVPTMLAGAARVILKTQASRLAVIAGGLVAPLLMFGVFVAVASNAAAQASWLQDVLWIGVSVVVLLFLGLAWDTTASSLHPFYKRRLSSAFALERFRRDGNLDAKERDYDVTVPLSDTRPTHPAARWPKLVQCAAANISDEGLTPPGRRSVTFTFDPDWIGGPEVEYLPTKAFETVLGPRRSEDITIPAAMAISGAALSPSMGSMTKPSLTLLLAMVNARLGVWLPRPGFARQRFNKLAEKAPGRKPHKNPLGKKAHFGYFLREMFAMNHARHKFLYVTDGGHWENLGLVELLRRGCTEIYSFDAAGDKEHTFFTIGEAIAMARAELGIEIELDPEKMRTDPSSGSLYSSLDHVYGKIFFPLQDDGSRVVGDIVFCKAAVTRSAPWDVRAYNEKDDDFPNHSLLAQMFADETFEAYRSLGADTATKAVGTMERKRKGHVEQLSS